MKTCPDFSIEAALRKQGYHTVCGTDEAGRGPLAGPVVAAAVVLDPLNIPDGLNDSKKLTEKRRTQLFETVMCDATVSIASVSSKTIDRMNIRAASLYAMQLAVEALAVEVDYVLVDGNALPEKLTCEARAIVKGDGTSLSIAAASIIAKVTRDQLMKSHDESWPEYGFAGHKGYPTASHREAVIRFGPCPIHRRSFAPVRNALEMKNPPPIFRSGF